MSTRTRAMKSNRKNQAKYPHLIRTILYSAIILILAGLILWIVLANKPSDSTSAANLAVPTETAAPASQSKQYTQAPEMQIDLSKTYYATVTMQKGGSFKIQLYADKAPITVNSFVFLARDGYFDGLTFHRVLEGFMAQGGDPTGTGTGGPGYEFVNEDSDLTFDKAGVVAMANAGRDTNGSQFFITFGPQESLNGGYTIFGQVVEGMDVVNSLTLRNPDENPNYAGDAIQTIVISEE
jgi:cyclophilin family peptidyl-prolyl cis-trans isomerase